MDGMGSFAGVVLNLCNDQYDKVGVGLYCIRVSIIQRRGYIADAYRCMVRWHKIVDTNRPFDSGQKEMFGSRESGDWCLQL